MLISELQRALNELAAPQLASEWDNVGLMLGDASREVTRVLVSLDVTPNALRRAADCGANVILSHHPLIFKPLRQITDPLLLELLERKIAVISMHTNLDVAPGGVNHALAQALELRVTGHLSPESGGKWHHVVVTVPPEHEDSLSQAAFAAGAGRIGNYSRCSTSHAILGTFAPESGARPFTPGARPHQVSRVSEVELEFMADESALPAILAALRANHPYETPLLYHFPVSNPNPAYGLGLVGELSQPLSLAETVALVRDKLQCPRPRLWTAGLKPSHQVGRLAVCGGAGSSLLKQAEAQADLFITGDISYHTMLSARIPLIDAGHFHTEYPVLETLRGYVSDLGIPGEVLPMREHEYYLNCGDYRD